jgi:hypothetical protein
MAIVTIRLDTDGEAVWFMELARKLGHEVEVDFGNNHRHSDGGFCFQEKHLPIGEYIVPSFDRQEAAYQLAGYLEDYQSKNPEK